MSTFKQSKLSFSVVNSAYSHRDVKDSVLRGFERLGPDYYISFDDSLKRFLSEDEIIIIKNALKKEDTCNKLRKSSSSYSKMSDDEIAAVYAYTFDFGEDKRESNIYRRINLILSNRSVNDMRNIRGYILHLLAALRHMGDNLIVKNVTLYRGIDGKKSFAFDRHSEGISRSWPAFTSTSLDRDTVVDDFLDKAETPILFEIQKCTGYKINYLSAHQDEEGNSFFMGHRHTIIIAYIYFVPF